MIDLTKYPKANPNRYYLIVWDREMGESAFMLDPEDPESAEWLKDGRYFELRSFETRRDRWFYFLGCEDQLADCVATCTQGMATKYLKLFGEDHEKKMDSPGF